MRVITAAVVLIALAGFVAATPLYERTRAPHGWTKLGRAVGSENVEFTVALKQQNLDKLHQIFEEVTNPKHEQYQNYRSIEEINELIAPPTEHKNAVMRWLLHGGVHSAQIKNYADAIDVKTTVAVVESLFNTEMHYYRHEDGRSIVRQFGVMTVPQNLKTIIELVTGLTTFPVPHGSTHEAKKLFNKMSNPNQQNDQAVIAQTLWKMYGIRAQHPGTSSGKTSQAVIEFQGQNYAPTDLSQYAQQVNLQVSAVGTGHTVGPNDPTNPQTEAELDIQMVGTVNLEAANWFWLEDGQGWLYQFGMHFFNTQDVPQVNSISYGWYEGDQCTIAPTECQSLGVDSIGYVNRVNTEFQKIAARGITLLVASGDSGANGRTNSDCSIPQLRPSFPGASPYVTTVGATQLNNPQFNLVNPPPICSTAGYSCASGGEEVAVSFAVSSFTSGGGFSTVESTPSWQKDAVNAYLNSGVALPPNSYFNKTGRGFPDVAAIGHNTMIEQSGQVMPVGGTSASTPIVAAIISLLNEAQIAKTGKPLGFLNPFLYQAWAADKTNFQDITVGDNKCTESGCAPACQGYMAAAGWDPVTGLGSLNFPKLLAYINSQ